jgi:hypothetical protein
MAFRMQLTLTARRREGATCQSFQIRAASGTTWSQALRPALDERLADDPAARACSTAEA